MTQVNPRFAVLAAFLMGAVAYQTGPPPGVRKTKAGAQTQPTHSTAGASGENQPEEDLPLKTICQFAATRSGARGEAENANCLPASHPIEFLIATVPDPQNSHYPFLFDAFVESIRLALEDSGYALDRFWLPWEAYSGPPDTDWQKRIQHQAWREKKQAYPGILLFRGQPDAKKESLFGVLLVGEDPIRGINKEQFGKALSLILKFRHPDDLKTVRVLGPSFSGSIPSLCIAMRNSEDVEIKYQVATGSATASINRETLENYVGRDRVSYNDSAIVNDEVATRSFFSNLKNLANRVKWKRIAILAESGSEFSLQFVKDVPTEASAPESPLILDYPMEISRLRNAYANDPELSALSSANASKAPPQGLQISLKDTEGTKDSIPSFSPELTPVSQEAALLNTLATISREKIEYVGIVASDVLDAIFLGHLLQQHCPDVRLFIIDSDLIYAHTDQNYSFEGMLMVTSYPLFTENQWWTKSWDGSRRRRQFTSANAEGVYNAGLLLLNPLLNPDKPTPLVEHATPQPDGKSTVPQPALWLTVVGRDGIWPVTALQPGPEPRRDALTESSRGWKLLFWCMTLFCGSFAAGVIVCNLGQDHEVRQGWLSVLHVAGNYPTTVQVCLSAALGVLLIAYGFIAAVQMSFFGLHGRYFAPIALSCALIPALLLTAAVPCWLTAKTARWGWIAAAAVAATSLAASALFSERMYVHPLSLFFVYRTVHVGNGVDPVVPAVLLAIALLWYVWVQLYRVHLCRKAVELPSFVELFSFPGDIYLSSVAKVKKAMFEALEKWRLRKWSWTVVAVLGLGIWLLQPMRSIETFPFEWPYAAGLCLLFAGLWLGCVRFFCIWWHLRKILRMLECHPLREVFKRLPPDLSPNRVWRWQGSRTDLTLSHSIERLRSLRAVGMSYRFTDDRDFTAHLEDLRNDAQKLIAADAVGTVPEKEPKTVAEVATFSDYLLKNVLTSYWETGNSADMPQAMVAAAEGSGTVPIRQSTTVPRGTIVVPGGTIAAAEEYVALRFVALFRYVTLHLKNLLEFVAGALILVLISLHSYPFQPLHWINTAISVCFFAGAAAFAGALMQMHGSPIMSYRGGGKAAKLDPNLLHVLSFGALPLITVLSSQFPSIGGFLFAWVKPALENLR